MTLDSLFQEGSEKRAIRSLRMARARVALSLSVESEGERRNRDTLMPRLAWTLAKLESAENLPYDAGEKYLNQATVDAALSTALARPVESLEARLSALCLSAQILSHDGQFARLRALRFEFLDVASQLKLSRPFYAATLRSWARVLGGNDADITEARAELRALLGLDPTNPPIAVEGSLENLGDILLANACRLWLVEGVVERASDAHYQDFALAIRDLKNARQFCVENQLVSAFELSSLLISYWGAVERFDPSLVVSQACPALSDIKWRRYLRQRVSSALFPVQRRAIREGLFEPGNLLLSLPTSAGKTLLAELRILAELESRQGAKVIYLAPYRTLARQVQESLSYQLRQAKRTVRDYGSEFDINLAEQFAEEEISDVAVMTPEKLDALMRYASSTRRGSQNVREYLASVALVVFDEIQVIGRVGRGPRLEILLVRLRQQFPHAALLALSGVIAGSEALCGWLDAKVISDSARPTGLIEVLWDAEGQFWLRDSAHDSGPVAFDKEDFPARPYDAAARIVQSIESQTRPVLLLEPKRKMAREVMLNLHRSNPRAGQAFRDQISNRLRDRLDEAAEEAEALLGDEELAELLRNGLAVHHAGLPGSLLRSIEDLARYGGLRALGTTTTVAEGAHLPFRAVVIPHLNFEGAGRRLTKDLYDNIVGRAGRAGVAAEGYVFILESAAMKGHVKSVLWQDQRLPIQGALAESFLGGTSKDQIIAGSNIRSQWLAWLGEPQNYVDDQPRRLAEATLTWRTSPNRRNNLVQSFAFLNREFESQGFAYSGSPFQLTEMGKRARLSGLAPSSCLRVLNSLDAFSRPLDAELESVSHLDDEISFLLSRLIFDTEEAISESLWLRQWSSEQEQGGVLRQMERSEFDWPPQDDLYRTNILLLSQWISGVSIANIANTLYEAMEDGNFSVRGWKANQDDAKSERFMLEYLIKQSQPASWAWSGIAALTESGGERIPTWIRGSVEYGVPTQTCHELCAHVGLSRRGSLQLGENLSAQWGSAYKEIKSSEWWLLHSARWQAQFMRNDWLRLQEWRNRQDRA